jgi:hypothetical protein
MAVIFDPLSEALSLTEPVSGTISGSVTLSAPTGIVDGVPNQPLPPPTITSVVCANASEFCQPYDMVITKTNQSFSFSSGFVDLFDRQIKYTKFFSILEISWNNVSLIDPVITTNGTNLVTISTLEREKYKVGDLVTITGGLNASQKRLAGTWPIVSIPEKASSKKGFKKFIIKINSTITMQSVTPNESFATYHAANRVRYGVPLDTSISPDDYYGLYQLNAPPESRLITFNITYTQGGATPQSISWSFKLLSNFDATSSLLTRALSRGSSYTPPITEIQVP